MEYRAQAEIDLSAIAFNVRQLISVADVPVMAVVKADAYGHGLIPVARTAVNAGAAWLGVALLEEALALRTAEITEPILAWLVPPSSDFVRAIEHEIDLAVPSRAIFDEIRQASRSTGKRARIHIELDTGMTRGGFLDEWDEFLDFLLSDVSWFSEVEVIGLFSHFARADEPGQGQNARQLKRFVEMQDDLNRIGIVPTISHLSNSAATLADASSHFDLVRTGIAMYGLTPNIEHLGSSQSLGLRPAMTLRAKLHLVKTVDAGTEVGYGAVGKTTVDTRLGIVAMGYADGIPRIAQGAGVFVHGSRAEVIGRISMDQFVVDLGKDSPARAGDWVTVFGPGSSGEYSADEWGAASQSINYEVVTRIGSRVPRVYSTISRSV
ncbi:MAG: alanine racemase [Actinobacteria bacterium]|nr:alanine racemase [Actinomycetota bacterium]